jgi:peptidoglycan L-alanyl-D-glutamate endopeptidase CwlK
MPAFSQSSRSKLSTCHPDLQVLFFEVIKHTDCVILEGHRNQADQEQAVKTGKSKTPWPTGKHNSLPSRAVDVAPFPIVDWKKLDNFLYFGGFVMGIAAILRASGKMTHGIRYGADWNQNQDVTDQSFIDAVHFELIGGA